MLIIGVSGTLLGLHGFKSSLSSKKRKKRREVSEAHTLEIKEVSPGDVVPERP